MYCIDKCRQVQPYSLVVNAVDRVAIPGVGARWVHTIQRHVWQVHRCLCACVPTMVNGTGGVVIWSGHLLWWLYGTAMVSARYTSPLAAHTHQGLTWTTLSPPLLTNQQNLMSVQMWGRLLNFPSVDQLLSRAWNIFMIFYNRKQAPLNKVFSRKKINFRPERVKDLWQTCWVLQCLQLPRVPACVGVPPVRHLFIFGNFFANTIILPTFFANVLVLFCQEPLLVWAFPLSATLLVILCNQYSLVKKCHWLHLCFQLSTALLIGCQKLCLRFFWTDQTYIEEYLEMRIWFYKTLFNHCWVNTIAN